MAAMHRIITPFPRDVLRWLRAEASRRTRERARTGGAPRCSVAEVVRDAVGRLMSDGRGTAGG